MPAGDSSYEWTGQLVKSTSKLAVSLWALRMGAQGALIFLFNMASKLTFSNHGCYLTYLAPFDPSRFPASLLSNFFTKSCSLGENYMRGPLPWWHQAGHRRYPRKVSSCSHGGREGTLSPFHRSGILDTTNRPQFRALVSWWFRGPDTQESRRSFWFSHPPSAKF